MVGRPRKKLVKHFDAFIEGDEDLRKSIFKFSSSNQQMIFHLFAQLDHVHYAFFQQFFAIPQTKFWDLILSQLSATAAGSSKNRNFCENYSLLEHVDENSSPYEIKKEKTLNLVGASHALWFGLSDPNYKERPDTLALWTAFYEINPSRTTWEWWIELCCREAKELKKKHRNKIYTDFYVAIEMEEWAEKRLGLLRPRDHWYTVFHMLLKLDEDATAIKHRIAHPYLRLVYTLTKSINAYNQASQFLDTFDIGTAGLMRAIAKYAPSMAMAFPTFAEREIRYEIFYQLSNYNLVSLPHQTWKLHREYENLKKEYGKLYGREPSLLQLAEEFKLDYQEVSNIYSQVSMQNPYSLDQKFYANSEDTTSQLVTLKDRLEDPQEKEMRELLENQEVLLLVLSRMPLSERKVFMMMNNLSDTIQDLAPDRVELDNFFKFINPVPVNSTNEKNKLKRPSRSQEYYL